VQAASVRFLASLRLRRPADTSVFIVAASSGVPSDDGDTDYLSGFIYRQLLANFAAAMPDFTGYALSAPPEKRAIENSAVPSTGQQHSALSLP